MEIINCEQRSEEWFAARCGIPTASNFDKIISSEGKRSKQRNNYIWKLAGERVTKTPEENSYKNMAMEIGMEREAEARETYELITGQEVTQVGFCVGIRKYKYGASPDGLIGDDGCLEIKCPLVSTHISYLIKGVLPATYIPQVQGQLLVTGRKWCDFVSYFPGVKPFILRVFPDKLFMELLIKELLDFCDELENVVKKLQ